MKCSWRCFLSRIIESGFVCGWLVVVLVLGGCVSYTNQMQETTMSYQAGSFERVQKKLSTQAQKKARSRDALVWRLEEASALRTVNRLEESNQSLEIADEMIRDFEDNRADVRLGQETISAFSNPANVTYEGWMTDRVMVSTYLGVNNIILGKEDVARVHLNKAYQRQRDAVDKNARRIEEEQREIASNKTTGAAVQDSTVQSKLSGLYASLEKLLPIADYVNPFTSYIRGLFFTFYGEDASDWEIATKSLEQAYGFAQGNKFVKEDYAQAERVANGENPDQNVTYVIFENGMGPFLSEYKLNLPLPIDGGIYPLSVAFPLFTTYPDQNNSLRVSSGNVVEETQVIADMDDVFGADFKAELPRIVARTIAAVVVRQASSIAANLALKETNDSTAQLLGGLAIWAFQAAINIADTRCWALLPHDFQVCRVPNPPQGQIVIAETRGNQRVSVVLPSADGVNLVYVKSVRPGTKMMVWTRKLGAH